MSITAPESASTCTSVTFPSSPTISTSQTAFPCFFSSSASITFPANFSVAVLMACSKVTVEQAIKTATEKLAGKVIEAELEKKHGKAVWEVEIVGEDGKVTEVHVDADSGAVIDMEAKEEKEHKGKGKVKK